MEEFVGRILDTLNFHYWKLMRISVDNDKDLSRTFPNFLLSPEKLIIYIGKEHVAIEYAGSYTKSISNENKIECIVQDYSNSENFIEKVIGVTYAKGAMNIPLSGYVDDVYLASIEATKILAENNWNFLAQEMAFMLNVSSLSLSNQFTRLRNCFFYQENNGRLNVRNIKWMDIFPLKREDVDDDIEELTVNFPDLHSLAREDLNYTLPEKLDFQHSKLTIINRFIELYNTEGVFEPEITRFLAEPENQFILKMAFFGKEIHAEKQCSWADNTNRPAIKPDFFVVGSDEMADIVEFKLPTIKTEKTVVGKINRETFSSEIHSYIAQTRVYRDYFEDPRNRELVKTQYGLNVSYPKRYLVVGRRWMFDSLEWRSIANEYQYLTIRTYDDIVDTVMGYLMS